MGVRDLSALWVRNIMGAGVLWVRDIMGMLGFNTLRV